MSLSLPFFCSSGGDGPKSVRDGIQPRKRHRSSLRFLRVETSFSLGDTVRSIPFSVCQILCMYSWHLCFYGMHSFISTRLPFFSLSLCTCPSPLLFDKRLLFSFAYSCFPVFFLFKLHSTRTLIDWWIIPLFLSMMMMMIMSYDRQKTSS